MSYWRSCGGVGFPQRSPLRVPVHARMHVQHVTGGADGGSVVRGGTVKATLLLLGISALTSGACTRKTRALMNQGTTACPQISPGGSATRLILLHFLFPVWFGAPARLPSSNMDGGQTQPTSPGNPEEDGGGSLRGGGPGER